jgi:RNA polymerase sigma-70 factor, ECF subfamily
MSGRRIDPVADVEAIGETDLLRLARQNDGRAFRIIVRRNNRRLYRVARAVLGDDGEAEDAVQEAYLRAFTHLAEFRGDASLSTWLTRITVNEALDRLRRRAVSGGFPAFDEGGHDADEAEVVSFPSAITDPERVLAQREILHLLERAIDDLPQAFRMVFVTRVVEEMSVEEAGAVLGLPEQTVRTRLHRARRLLRQAIKAEIGAAVTKVFPFAGPRCTRITSQVLDRLEPASPLAG